MILSKFSMNCFFIDYITIATFFNSYIQSLISLFVRSFQSVPLSGYLDIPIEKLILKELSYLLHSHETRERIYSINARNSGSLFISLITIINCHFLSVLPITPRYSTTLISIFSTCQSNSRVFCFP